MVMGYGNENPIFYNPSSGKPDGESGNQDYGQRRGFGRPDNPLEYDPNGKLYQGSAIRQKRQEKGISLRGLAELVGYHSGSLSNIENNRTRISEENLTKIAIALGVPMEELKEAPLHPNIPAQLLESHKLTFDTRVEQIMDEFGLSQAEKEITRGLILDFTRSMSLRLKEMRIKESAPKPPTQESQ